MSEFILHVVKQNLINKKEMLGLAVMTGILFLICTIDILLPVSKYSVKTEADIPFETDNFYFSSKQARYDAELILEDDDWYLKTNLPTELVKRLQADTVHYLTQIQSQSYAEESIVIASANLIMDINPAEDGRKLLKLCQSIILISVLLSLQSGIQIEDRLVACSSLPMKWVSLCINVLLLIARSCILLMIALFAFSARVQWDQAGPLLHRLYQQGYLSISWTKIQFLCQQITRLQWIGLIGWYVVYILVGSWITKLGKYLKMSFILVAFMVILLIFRYAIH